MAVREMRRSEMQAQIPPMIGRDKAGNGLSHLADLKDTKGRYPNASMSTT